MVRSKRSESASPRNSSGLAPGAIDYRKGIQRATRKSEGQTPASKPKRDNKGRFSGSTISFVTMDDDALGMPIKRSVIIPATSSPKPIPTEETELRIVKLTDKWSPKLSEAAEKQLPKALEEVAVMNKKFSQNVTYGVVTEKGNIYATYGGSCYGGFYYSGGSWNVKDPRNDPPAFVITATGLTEAEFKMAESFLSFLLNDSFLAPAFHTKDPQEMLENGLVLYAHFPQRFIVQAMMAVRAVRTMYNPNTVGVWNTLEKIEGLDKDILLYALAYVSRQISGNIKDHFIWGINYLGWHSTTTTAKMFKRMITHDMSSFNFEKDTLSKWICGKPPTIGRSYPSLADVWYKKEDVDVEPLIMTTDLFKPFEVNSDYSSKPIRLRTMGTDPEEVTKLINRQARLWLDVAKDKQNG